MLTGLVGVAQQGLLLGADPRAGPVLHPRGDGELVAQVLGHHRGGDVGRPAPVEAVDEVAVPPAVRQQGRRPIGGGAGGGEEVRAARRRS